MLSSRPPSPCPAAEDGLPPPPAQSCSWIPLNPQFVPRQSLRLHLPFSVCHQRHAELQLLFLLLPLLHFLSQGKSSPCPSSGSCAHRRGARSRDRSSRAVDALPLSSISRCAWPRLPPISKPNAQQTRCVLQAGGSVQQWSCHSFKFRSVELNSGRTWGVCAAAGGRQHPLVSQGSPCSLLRASDAADSGQRSTIKTSNYHICPHGHQPEGEITAIFSCEQPGFLKIPVSNFCIFSPPWWSLPSQKSKNPVRKGINCL